MKKLLLLLLLPLTALADTGLAIVCPASISAGQDNGLVGTACGGWTQTGQVYKTPTDGDLVRVNSDLNNWSNANWKFKAWTRVAVGENYESCADEKVAGSAVPGNDCTARRFIPRSTVVALTPVGPGKLADTGSQFIPTVDMHVTYCVSSGPCGPAGSVLAGSTYNCNALSFPGSPAGANQCFGVIPPAQEPTQYCWPTKTDIAAFKWKFIILDSSVSTYYTHLAIWTDSCVGKVVAQYGNPTEIAEVAAEWAKCAVNPWTKCNDDLKAYQAFKTVRPNTPSEYAFKITMVATYSPRAGVKPLTSTAIDAPVYVLNADGTRHTTSVPGKRAPRGTPCDMTKRISTTSYYLVPSLTGGQYYATCAVVPGL